MELKMIKNAETELTQTDLRALDDAYLAWFSAESECESALHAWLEGAGGDGATAYAVYRAALDREEAAARDLQRLWELPEPRLGHESESVCK
jgi:hypothetical protein